MIRPCQGRGPGSMGFSFSKKSHERESLENPGRRTQELKSGDYDRH